VLWTPRDDRTLELVQVSESERDLARSRVERLGACGERDLAEHLIASVNDGILQARTLMRLGRACHGHDDARDPARGTSEVLFGFVLPTPTAGLDVDFFWRVVRRLDATGQATDVDAPARRILSFKTFIRRAEAAEYGTRLGDRLVSVTESQPAQGQATTTLWFWDDA